MDISVREEVIFKSAFEFKPLHFTLEDIFRQCFHNYFENLYGYAFTIVKDSAEAKDIVQSAFIKLWEKRSEVNIATSARSYLYTSVYHLSLNATRNLKTRQDHHKQLVSQDVTDNFYSSEEKELRIKIQTAVDQLPPRCKEVFYKSRFEGKKYAEIANDLKISIKTVEVQIGKALKILRELLSDVAMLWILHFFL